VTTPGGGLLDLRSAAAELGVHYQTAYGWVRSGRLPAELVGGRYMVTRQALETVRTERNTPRQPLPPGAARLERSADKMHEALMVGDEPAVRQLARRLTKEGTSIVDLIQKVFVPPLVRIGMAWHEGRLTIWVEHRASAIVERVIGELAPNPRGRRRGTALVAAVSGDHHSLPTTMAAMALREDGWHVEHLGCDMPPDELVRFCADHPVRVAVITSTNPDVAERAKHVASRLLAAGTPALVGGPGRTLEALIDEARAAGARTRTRSVGQ